MLRASSIAPLYSDRSCVAYHSHVGLENFCARLDHIRLEVRAQRRDVRSDLCHVTEDDRDHEVRSAKSMFAQIHIARSVIEYFHHSSRAAPRFSVATLRNLGTGTYRCVS